MFVVLTVCLVLGHKSRPLEGGGSRVLRPKRDSGIQSTRPHKNKVARRGWMHAGRPFRLLPHKHLRSAMNFAAKKIADLILSDLRRRSADAMTRSSRS